MAKTRSRPAVPAVRVLPMSDRIEGFRDLDVRQVQQRFFLGRLPAGRGRFHYCSSGLRTEPGAAVLFQFQARIVASAIFLRDERYAEPAGDYAGAMVFDPASITTFDPLDLAMMRDIWPGFRGFGHVKQQLNPTCYPKFLRSLKGVQRVKAKDP